MKYLSNEALKKIYKYLTKDKEERRPFFKKGQTETCSFDYLVCHYEGYEWVEIYDLYATSEHVKFPTVVEDKPVVYISMPMFVDKRNVIKSIEIGGNLFIIHRLDRAVSSLREIIISSDVELPLDVIIDYLRLASYSEEQVSYQLPDKLDLKIQNNCIISKDEKELYYWFGHNEKDIVIPENVEIIHEHTFPRKLKRVENIIWPKHLKVLDDHAFSLFNFEFFKMFELPDTIEYAGDSCFLAHPKEEHHLSPVYVDDNNVLHIASSVRDLSDKLVAIMHANDVAPTKNFVHKDGLLMSKDETVLYKVISKKNNEKKITVPYTVKRICRHAFCDLGILQKVRVVDTSLMTHCLFYPDPELDVKIELYKVPSHLLSNENNSLEESVLSLKEFQAFLSKKGLKNIFNNSEKFSFLLKKENGEPYQNFDELIDALKDKVQAVRINVARIRKDLKRRKLSPQISRSVEFCEAFEDYSFLGDFFLSMLEENKVVPPQNYYTDTSGSESEIEKQIFLYDKALINYVYSKDFDCLCQEYSSDIFIIHSDEMSKQALIICDMAKLPKKCLGQYLICKTKTTNYFVQLVPYW